MKQTVLFRTLCLTLLAVLLAACSQHKAEQEGLRPRFKQIFNVAYTPDTLHRCNGWFTDAGSWMGFTLPEKEQWVNGFCGPFSLDMLSRRWMARSAAEVAFAGAEGLPFVPDSTCYLPGELYLKAHNDKGTIEQQLCFANASTALLRVRTSRHEGLVFSASGWHKEVTLAIDQQSVVAVHPSGECVVITFPHEAMVALTAGTYRAELPATAEGEELTVALSFYPSLRDMTAGQQSVNALLLHPEEAVAQTQARWEEYLGRVMRSDMPADYDRIAAKSVTTLISNWRTHRGGLLHEGIIPSHAVGYFVGYWAWDSWRFCVAAARIFPELAKNNMRAMFDYQLPDGMIIDCIYTDPAENNARDSKPPLACWAVDEIFMQTGDTAFVAEMYPQLLAYYKWWYAYRDHDHNGMCEYGATDGTLEAAAWESGMDNAIRFDGAKMLKNDAPNAWSMDRESVDLNAYLALECRLLKKFAALLDVKFDGPDHADRVASYFFDEKEGFFFDRLIGKEEYVAEPGCEAYTPLWTGVATPEQVERMLPILQDTARFSTFIPFPTIAADNPKYNPRGYWRGPIWLDQTYFAIHGLRAYGYKELADEYTRQVFDRLQGLKEGAPIHENYDTHTGARLKAPHFSWSAVHLLLLYEEYGR